MDQPDFVILYQAQSIIERDALIERFADEGIDAFAAPRDMSRKVADGTIDLALGGYSAVSGGLPVLVRKDQKDQALKLLEQFQRETQVQLADDVTPETAPNLNRFVFCSLFSWIMPGVLSIPAAYYFVQGLRQSERISTRKFVIGILLFIPPLVGLIFLGRHLRGL